MEKEFVTFDIAKKVQELGFKEKCLTSYTDFKKLNSCFNFEDDERNALNQYIYWAELPNSAYCINPLCSEFVAAPLWQQIIDWLLKKYQLHVQVESYRTEVAGKYTYVGWLIHERFETPDEIDQSEYVDTTYEAREKAILEALELITNKEQKDNE